jgi:hypothetical protein
MKLYNKQIIYNMWRMMFNVQYIKYYNPFLKLYIRRIKLDMSWSNSP